MSNGECYEIINIDISPSPPYPLSFIFNLCINSLVNCMAFHLLSLVYK